MSYQVTFTLNSAYTGTTQADDFTIIGKHANGSPSDTTIATGVTKADLTTGVTYTVDDTITGGTITSTGTCTNSVPWIGLGGITITPTPTPTSDVISKPPATQKYSFIYCGGHFENNPTAGLTIIVTDAQLVTAGKSDAVAPVGGDTIELTGSGNVGAVYEYQDVSTESQTDNINVSGFNISLCPNPN